MAQNKTQAGDASVDAHLAALADEDQRRDCAALVQLMRRVTGEAPRMWGPSIVGFGRYHYRYDSGREGEACLTGFAARRSGLAVYLMAAGPAQAVLLGRLGRHAMGKACLNLRRLADVDLAVLEQLVADAVAETRRRHGPGAA